MSDFKDTVKDFFESVKDRFGNPLVVPFILVWSYHHWRFLYEMLTYNNAVDVKTRSDHFNYYVIVQGYKGMLLCPLGQSIISLMAFYLLLILAKFIKLMFGERLPSFILRRFDKAKYVLRTVADELESQNKELHLKEEKLEKEIRELKSDNKSKISEIETLNSENKNTIRTHDDIVGKLNAEILTLKNQVDSKTQQFLLSQAEIENYKNLVEHQSQEREKLEKEHHEEKASLKEALTDAELLLTTYSDKDQIMKIEWDGYLKQLPKFAKHGGTMRNISTSINTIFPEGSRWRFQHVEFNTTKSISEVFFVLGSMFVVENARGKGEIEITHFTYDAQNKTVFFKKTNLARGYKDVLTKLEIKEDSDLLSGIEGDNASVSYIKIG